MASINPRPLKAYVRFDGTGRIVPSSLILRRKMPKVGKWKEIPAYECCNSTPTTSTTTTQGGGVTPTAFLVPFWSSGFDSCNFAAEGNIIVYSASSVLTAGSYVYFDAALTQPVTPPYVILYDNIRYSFPAAPGELVVYNCPPSQTINVNITNGNCGTVIANQTVNLLYTPTLCSTNESIPVLVGDFSAFTNPFYVTYNGISSLFNKVSNTLAAGSYDFPCVNCSSTTTTTTQAPVFTVENLRWGNTQSDACTLVNPPLTIYTTGPLQFGAYVQSGNVIYLDQALTQPVQYPFILSGGLGQLFDCSNGLLSNQRSC